MEQMSKEINSPIFTENDHIIGLHIDSDVDNIINETLNVHKHNGKIIQLFINKTSKHAKEKYTELKNLLVNNKMKCVVHSSYTINLAKEWTYHSWWIKQFIIEIDMASYIGAYAIVIHLGKQLDISYEEAINNMYTSLMYINTQTKDKNVKILLETSSGQGTEMCYEIDKLAHFCNKFLKHKNKEICNRFGICLDTCHIFEAGYDIRGNKNIESYIKKYCETTKDDTEDDLMFIKTLTITVNNGMTNEIESVRYCNVYKDKNGKIYIVEEVL